MLQRLIGGGQGDIQIGTFEEDLSMVYQHLTKRCWVYKPVFLGFHQGCDDLNIIFADQVMTTIGSIFTGTS